MERLCGINLVNIKGAVLSSIAGHRRELGCDDLIDRDLIDFMNGPGVLEEDLAQYALSRRIRAMELVLSPNQSIILLEMDGKNILLKARLRMNPLHFSTFVVN